ncbi:hypothetical protein BS50DRAFT_659899 [Corynespora cassiicola Philippines]|uniref:Aminoglycoside phosphotransferase domain-containing protein n=1 Tax=Corynespora cassiicola Philippines TaxID=1448308 RepID=A0A2T2NZY8_CORCC|nr:hypothetical protein BS50DRAFT_659899 [Corynespora cassiicola Philippines]
MIEEMRRITAPQNTGVSNINGGSLYDARIPGPSNHFGPFVTICDFHRYLRGGIEAHPQHKAEIGELISWHDAYQSDLVFTHGDLSSLNIPVSGDEVVGMVDRETAGWFPAYWEYGTAWNANPQNQFWNQEVQKFLHILPKDLDMEKLRHKYFGLP